MSVYAVNKVCRRVLTEPELRMGCNHFLMHLLGRFGLFGLDLKEEAARVRAAHR